MVATDFSAGDRYTWAIPNRRWTVDSLSGFGGHSQLLRGFSPAFGFQSALRLPPAPGPAALAAALGGVYSGACLIRGFSFLGSLPWRLVFLTLMALTAFGWGKSSWKRAGVFVLLTMSLGGIALSMGKGDFFTLLLCAALLWLLCRFVLTGSVSGQEYVPISLTYRDKVVSVTALRDTGNTLRDPLSGERVLVISAQSAEKLTGPTTHQPAHPLETMTQRPLPGLRLIPYRAVGQSGGILLGLRFDHIRIGSRTTSAIVAFAPEGLGQGGMVQALTGGML